MFVKYHKKCDFSILAIFSPKMIKILKIVDTHDPKPVRSWKFCWSLTFSKVLWLKCKKIWFYSPKELILGVILQEILECESMETGKLKLSYFPRTPRYLHSLKSVDIPVIGTSIWISHPKITPDLPPYCLHTYSK